MVEVFKTNVQEHAQAAVLSASLARELPCRINFDLEDCDRILRIEGDVICQETVIRLLRDNGYECEVLL
jgi:hypothetical protein